MQQDLTEMAVTNSTMRKSLSSPLLWIVFFVYLLVLGYTAAHHEPWGDEIHSWNIAKGSNSYFDVIHNSRFEGHPPTWYSILWTISKFTNNFSWVQAAHAVIAALIVFAIIFLSPLPVFARLMLPFGYFFLYEYAVLSRNYAIGILAALCLCFILRKSFRYKIPLYYFLLLVISNTHLLALVLAGSLHLYFLLFTIEKKGRLKVAAGHAVAGALVLLPAIYFIMPPSDSQLNVQFWMDRWSLENIKRTGQAPLRSFLPLPAWWKYNIWNTHFLLDGGAKSIIVNFFVAIGISAVPFFILRSNKKALSVFIVNFLLCMVLSIAVFPLTSSRYAGFLFIGFVVALWLYCYEARVIRINKWLVIFLLVMQMIPAAIFVARDIDDPFSKSGKVNEMMAEIPVGEKTVTDYWGLNTISTFANRPFYCIDLQKEISFVLWGPELGQMLKKPNRYVNGVKNYFQQNGVDRLYMISHASPALLFRTDPQLNNIYRVELVDKIDGAIERNSNLYLYKISSR